MLLFKAHKPHSRNTADILPLTSPFQGKLNISTYSFQIAQKMRRFCRFLLVCLDRRRCAFSVFPDKDHEQISLVHKLDLLRTFYRNTVGSVFPWSVAAPPMYSTPSLHLGRGAKSKPFVCLAENSVNGFFTHAFFTDIGPTVHKASESYWSSEYHKCHAMTFAIFQLFVIYDPEVPMLHMRFYNHK